MKFKRILALILCFGICLTLVGCGNQNTTNAVANNLDKNTAKLENVLDKIEDVNYKNIIIDEISPLSDETFNTISNNKNLQKTKWYSVTKTSANNFVPKKASKDKNRRDAKYVSNNNAKKVGLTDEQTNTPSNTVKKIGKPKTSTKQTYFINNDGIYSYKPKYVNYVTESFNRDCIDNYISQIEIIYEECADCIGCNAECKNEKVILKQNIEDCKTLIRKMRDGTIQLSDEDITKCNDCINDLNDCINRLNSTKNNVKSKEKSVKDIKNNFYKMPEELQISYSKLLESLENRLDCLVECNDCMNCICNTINNTNIDMTDALENKSDENDIIDYENLENQNIDAMNNYSNNQNDYIVTNQVPNQISQIPNNNGYRNINNNLNYAYGYYNNGIGNNMYGYNGYYNGFYPYTPRNIDTYGIINKNIDTYAPYKNNIQMQNIQQNENLKNQNDAPLPNPFDKEEIKNFKEKFKNKSHVDNENENIKIFAI